MAKSYVDNSGMQVPIIMRQGANFGPLELQLKKADGTAFDLSGAVVRGQIRKQALDAQPIKEFQCEVTDQPGGVCTIYMHSSDTVGIPAGESPNDDASRYTYDVEADINGSVTAVIRGSVMVVREVTR